MPFFEPAYIKTGCVSLQVQKQLKNNSIYNFIFRKRAYLFTSNGSVTVEATIAITVFMMLMLFIESFLMMLNSSMVIQTNVNNIALETAKNKFYVQLAGDISEKSETLTDIRNKLSDKIENQDNVSEEIAKMMEKGIEVTYLYSKLTSSLNTEAFNSKLCRIRNFSMSKSSINNEIIDMVVEYKIRIPYINKQFSLVQRGRVRGWTGQDISQEQSTVYITKSGKVYHKSRDCSYLVVKISKVLYSQVSKLRNCYGEKYSKCQLCVKCVLQNSEGVFVTEDGNRYHADLKCSGIKRSVMSIDITQVGDKVQCSKCGQGE